MAQLPITGRCNCGGVRFSLSAPPLSVGYCHCTRCQRRTGTAASANAGIDAGTLTINAGEELLTGWRHPDGGFVKLFCSVCGSQLFARNPDNPAQMAVRFSAFDADPGVPPSYRQFVDDAAAWEPIPDDGLTRFAGARLPPPVAD
jgi:hypothetical protein